MSLTLSPCLGLDREYLHTCPWLFSKTARHNNVFRSPAGVEHRATAVVDPPPGHARQFPPRGAVPVEHERPLAPDKMATVRRWRTAGAPAGQEDLGSFQISCPHLREGGHAKADIVREDVLILQYKSNLNAHKGGGGQKIQ